MQNLQYDNMFYSRPFPYPSFPPPNPIVIGEGEVATVVCPDGSLQYFFQPTAARWPPDVNIFNGRHSCCPCICSSPSSAVWFIKSIQPAFGNQLDQIHVQPQFNQQSNLDLMSSNRPLELKFHNDGWTSTTDLHYFFPSLRCREWIPKVGAQVQVEIPTERDIFHFVTPKEIRKEESKMEIEEDKSTHECKCKVKFEKSVATSSDRGCSPSNDGQTQTRKKRGRPKKSMHNISTCGSDCSACSGHCGCHSD